MNPGGKVVGIPMSISKSQHCPLFLFPSDFPRFTLDRANNVI